MNKVILIGRLTKDPVVNTPGVTKIAKFTLAVDRSYRAENAPKADFISCIAFSGTAEFLEKYIRQGTKIVVEGRIQTGSYNNREGVKVYTTDVVVENVEFAESKAASENKEPQPPKAKAPQATGDEEWMQVDDLSDAGLPFN